jgi:hypothetical protein
MASKTQDRLETHDELIEKIERAKAVALALIHAVGDVVTGIVDEVKRVLVALGLFALTLLGLWGATREAALVPAESTGRCQG